MLSEAFEPWSNLKSLSKMHAAQNLPKFPPHRNLEILIKLPQHRVVSVKVIGRKIDFVENSIAESTFEKLLIFLETTFSRTPLLYISDIGRFRLIIMLSNIKIFFKFDSKQGNN